MSQIVVVDIGGSGMRLGLATQRGVISIRREAGINTVADFAAAVRRLVGGGVLDAVALSVAGFVHNNNVQLSARAGWLVGNTAEKISLALGINKRRVYVVNDGEAHAMALRRHPETQLGAINIALGTSVGFGAIDVNGNVMRSLSGDNWDLGDFKLHTRAADKSLWHALGGEFGLKELMEWSGSDGAKHYGYRLGAFAIQMAFVFRPKTIGLSGGVIKHYWKYIKPGFDDEFSILNQYSRVLSKPKVIALSYDEPALAGLATLFF